MRLLNTLTVAGLFLFLCSQATASADDAKPVELEVGDKAPSFEGKDDSGKDWKSSDHVGKKIVVVYFYPAALTGG